MNEEPTSKKEDEISQQSNSTRKTIGWLLFIAGILMSGCLMCYLVSLAATGGTTSFGRVELTILMALGVFMFSLGMGLAFGKPRKRK